MPSSEYTSASGGALKLKGGAGVDKKKKKRKPKSTDVEPSRATSTSEDPASTSADITHPPSRKDDSEITKHKSRSISPGEAESEIRKAGGRYKTEAERRHEETRRKRLNERVKREGFKTHKERVEELNKYLSGLSEHHDMPKIGPG